jgi:hypothetical protein
LVVLVGWRAQGMQQQVHQASAALATQLGVV